ncbi:MAG: hypothetical protein D6797_01595 [Bdellovibrio sp.]|nr:MAG: hypothetical protein D6797_01595 [Bdellovibrio sp.]
MITLRKALVKSTKKLFNSFPMKKKNQNSLSKTCQELQNALKAFQEIKPKPPQNQLEEFKKALTRIQKQLQHF